MSLTENTTYSGAGSTISDAVKAAYAIGKSLPRKKSPAINQASYTPPEGSSGLSEGSSVAGLGNVTTQYGGSTKYESFHPGIDIANTIGTTIKSFTPGVVEEVSTGKKQGDAGYGNYVMIRDPEGNLLRYSHLHDEFLRVGDQVEKGTDLGTIGNSGQTYSLSKLGTGAHVDIRIRDVYGKYVNPSRFIN